MQRWQGCQLRRASFQAKIDLLFKPQPLGWGSYAKFNLLQKNYIFTAYIYFSTKAFLYIRTFDGKKAEKCFHFSAYNDIKLYLSR
jgi:hypothetical protein